MTQKSYQVAGMTCAHCTAAVSREVSAVAGVRSVEVTLGAGEDPSAVIVASENDDDVSDRAVRAAVSEAGYEVL